MRITLKDTESALVINNEGGIRFYLPKQNTDENVSPGCLLISTIAILISRKDKKFQKLVSLKQEEFFKEYKESEEGGQ